ncbi:MAG: addiction module component CHP02574 family protein [Candidatus Brocadia sp. WS118]|nr:MAG: addiction module component CHP02574 family protein [Candidatus Brocadia sp. WS118]
MEELWDSLGKKEEIASPEWHKDILKERNLKIEKGNAEYVSLEDLKGSRHQ